MSAPTATVKKTPTPADLVHQVEANEWGQITGLEPHEKYFVVRRPTAQMTREMSNQMLTDLKAFVAAQREVAEKQVAEINEKVVPRAMDTVQKAREEFERRIDVLTKEFETRVEKLEAELGERAPKFLRREKVEESPATNASTQGAPGELPLGDNAHPTVTPAAEAAPAEAEKASKKKGKKSE